MYVPPSSLSINMSDSFAFANSKEFTDFMLNLPPATNEAAFQYGFGFGEDFELDYEAFTEAHTYELPKATRLQPEFTGGNPPPPPSNPPASGPVARGDTPPSSLIATDVADTNSTLNHHLPLLPPFSPAPAPTIANTGNFDITPPPTPAVKKAGGRRAKFPPAALEQLARVVYMVNLYGASHGKKASAWEEVATKLKGDGHFKNSSTETIRNKMAALLAYFEVSSNLHHII